MDFHCNESDQYQQLIQHCALLFKSPKLEKYFYCTLISECVQPLLYSAG